MVIFLAILTAYIALMIYLNVKVEPGSKRIPAHLETTRSAMSLSRDFPRIFFIGLVAAIIEEFIQFKEFIRYILEFFGFAEHPFPK